MRNGVIQHSRITFSAAVQVHLHQNLSTHAADIAFLGMKLLKLRRDSGPAYMRCMRSSDPQQL